MVMRQKSSLISPFLITMLLPGDCNHPIIIKKAASRSCILCIHSCKLTWPTPVSFDSTKGSNFLTYCYCKIYMWITVNLQLLDSIRSEQMIIALPMECG